MLGGGNGNKNQNGCLYYCCNIRADGNGYHSAPNAGGVTGAIVIVQTGMFIHAENSITVVTKILIRL